MAAHVLTIGAVLALALAAPAHAAGGEGGGEFGYRVFNALLLLIVLAIFARKPVLAFFAERRTRIQDELKQAAELRREAEERHSKWQRRLVALETELESIRATGRERGQREREKILADARAAAERIRSDARAAVDQEVRRAKAQLRREASELAVELASEILREQITADDRARLLDEFVARIQSGARASEGG